MKLEEELGTSDFAQKQKDKYLRLFRTAKLNLTRARWHFSQVSEVENRKRYEEARKVLVLCMSNYYIAEALNSVYS